MNSIQTCTWFGSPVRLRFTWSSRSSASGGRPLGPHATSLQPLRSLISPQIPSSPAASGGRPLGPHATSLQPLRSLISPQIPSSPAASGGRPLGPHATSLQPLRSLISPQIPSRPAASGGHAADGSDGVRHHGAAITHTLGPRAMLQTAPIGVRPRERPLAIACTWRYLASRRRPRAGERAGT